MSSQQKQKNDSFTIAGADGELIEIAPGEFYFNTKARARRMMKDSLSADARRVYACLELHTMGWQQELAVIMRKGQKIPMTPGHLVELTGVSKQNVRRALAELEAAGLVERREIEPGKGLIKGNIQIYSWAVPRSPSNQKGSQRETTFPTLGEEFQQLTTFLKRWKISVTTPDFVPARAYLVEAQEIVAKAEKVNLEAVAHVKRVFAQDPLYKEERTERTNTERTPPTGRTEKASPVVEDPPEPPRPPDPVPSDKDSPLRRQIREYLAGKPIPTKLDEPMFERIAQWITTEEQFEGFKKAADGVKDPRKWAIFEAIAKQVEARGTIPKPPPKEDPLLEQFREYMGKRAAWPTG